jgi:hypothetical protein
MNVAAQSRGRAGESERGGARVLREPTLKELLSEPIIRALMEADGVDPEEFEAMLPAAKPFNRFRRASLDVQNPSTREDSEA